MGGGLIGVIGGSVSGYQVLGSLPESCVGSKEAVPSAGLEAGKPCPLAAITGHHAACKGVGYRKDCGRQVLFGDSDETLEKPVAPAYALEASPPGPSHGPSGALVTASSPRAPV